MSTREAVLETVTDALDTLTGWSLAAKRRIASVVGLGTTLLAERGLTARRLVLGGVSLTIAGSVLVPLVFLLWTSVWSGYPGQLDATFTLDNFVTVYLGGAYDVLALLSNSLFVATGMTLIAMSFGLLFAWLFVRTNLPTKGAMELAIVSPYAVPAYIYAIIYITAYGPKNGLVSTLLTNLLGLESAPFDIFSPLGITFVIGVNAVTTFYLLTVPALKDVNPALEEVSRIHGANLLQTVRSVSFPLILPAIVSAALVTFLRGLGEFSVVAILGSRDGFDVYATAIWRSIRIRALPRYGEAAALACSFLVATLVLVWYYRKLTSRKEDFMTLTGRGYQPNMWDLGRWRWPIALALWAVLLLVWVLPILIMVLVSLHSTWFGQPDLSTLTLSHYVAAVTNLRLQDAFLNSTVVGVTGATVGTVLVVGLAYYVERTDGRFRGLVDFLSLTPLAIPGIIMGASVLFLFLWLGKVHPALNFYGTLVIIIVGSVIVYIPFSSRIAVGNVVQIHSRLEEAARLCGASWTQQMREIFLPLFRDTTAIIWFYLLIHIFQLITVAIMTYTSSTRVVPVEVFTLYLNANLELVSAISTMFVGTTLLLLLLLRYMGITFYELGGW